MDAARARRDRSPTPSRVGLFAPRWRWLTASIVLVMSLAAFESIATATIMPVAAADLDALTGYTWAFNAFIVASLLGMVAAGVWCDASGPRGSMAVGLGALAIGSVAAALATDLARLVAGRAVQGLGAGAIMVTVYVVIARAYPAELRPRAFSLLSAAWVVPSLIGPFVAGWLAEVVSWRAVFWLIPVLVIAPFFAMVVRLRAYQGGRQRADGRRRLRAAVMAGIGLLGIQDGVLRGGWLGVVEVFVGLMLLGLAMPALLPAGALRLGRGLPTVVVVHGIVAGAYFSAEMFVPLALVQLRGSSTTLAGLVLAGGAITWSLGSILQSRMSDGADRSRIVRVGASLVSIFVLFVALAFVIGVPQWGVMLLWAGASLGMGLTFPSLAVQAMRLAPRDDQGVTSSALQVVDSVFIVLVSSTIGLFYAGAERSGSVDATTFAVMWVAVAVAAGAAGVIAPRMRPRTG